jgi:pimeloyl-ACP methyl ester carboxylesterase
MVEKYMEKMVKKIIIGIVSTTSIVILILVIFYNPFSLYKYYSKHNKYHQGATQEKITLTARKSADSTETITRKALLIRRPGAKNTVVFFHGFMCNKNDIRFLARDIFGPHPLFNDTFNILIPDFRAHGETDANQCCSFGFNEKYDVIAAVDFIKNHPELKKTHRIAYGFSMGAVATILALAEDPTLFDMAILDCPFESTENIIARGLDKAKWNIFGCEICLPGRSLLQRYAFHPYVQSVLKYMLKTIAKMDATEINTCIIPVDTIAAAKKLSIPLFFIACKNDDKAPVAAVKEVYQASRGFKRLWITDGQYHFGSYFYYPEKYVYKIRSFIHKVCKGTIAKKTQEKIISDLQELTPRTA